MIDSATYSEPLCVISLADTEQRFEGIVSGYHKSSNIGKELTSDVEKDGEKVERA